MLGSDHRIIPLNVDNARSAQVPTRPHGPSERDVPRSGDQQSAGGRKHTGPCAAQSRQTQRRLGESAADVHESQTHVRR